MKKLIALCKPHLPEISFALSTVLLICAYIVCWHKFSGFNVGLCGAVAMVLEIALAFGLSHLSKFNHKSFRLIHYLCFGLWEVIFVVGILFSDDCNKEIFILFSTSIVVFCALYSDLTVVTHLSNAD